MPRVPSPMTSAAAGGSVAPFARLALVKVIPGVADFGTSHVGLIGRTGSALAWPFREGAQFHGASLCASPNLSRSTLALPARERPRASHLAATRRGTASTTRMGGRGLHGASPRGSLWGSPGRPAVRCGGFSVKNRCKITYSAALRPV